MLFRRVINRIKRACYHLFNHRCYGRLERSAVVQCLHRIDGKRNIFIGNRAMIQKGSWLASEGRLEIKDGAIIGHFNHIYAKQSIVIEEEVLTADKVYVSDCAHTYEDVDTPVWRQPIKQLKPVVIGRGAWLGENVCVIGASVGRGSVVGANSVVTKDIPDYCVAVGSPAKVIKKYNTETKKWEKI